MQKLWWNVREIITTIKVLQLWFNYWNFHKTIINIFQNNWNYKIYKTSGTIIKFLRNYWNTKLLKFTEINLYAKTLIDLLNHSWNSNKTIETLAMKNNYNLNDLLPMSLAEV